MKLKVLLLSLFILVLTSFSSYAKDHKVRFGALPILDVLPVYVAEERGFFKEYSVNLDIVPCASASERDQLLVSGNIDLTINDLISLALLNKDRTHVKGLRYAMLPTQKFFQFALVSSKDSKIFSVKDLKGVPIGVSYATIVHYVTERILKSEGLAKEDIRFLTITRIPDRLSALVRGDLKAACLPEPFATFAISQGANLVLDDRKYPHFSGSLYSVSKSFLDRNPEVLKKFLLAVERAIAEINKDKSICNHIIVQKKLVPVALSTTYVIPDFPEEKIPEEKIWEDVISWLIEKGLLNKKVPYSESIERIQIKK